MTFGTRDHCTVSLFYLPVLLSAAHFEGGKRARSDVMCAEFMMGIQQEIHHLNTPSTLYIMLNFKSSFDEDRVLDGS